MTDDEFQTKVLTELGEIKTVQALQVERHDSHLKITEDLKIKIDGCPETGTPGIDRRLSYIENTLRFIVISVPSAAAAWFAFSEKIKHLAGK